MSVRSEKVPLVDMGDGDEAVRSLNLIRDPGEVVVYRDSVATPLTAADVLAVPTFAVSAVNSGSLTGSWRCQVVAGNKYGRTTSNSIQTQSLTSQNLGVTITPVDGAEWYDIFASDDATPLYLGRVTAAQVAAGCSITGAATSSANATIGASVSAGRVDVSVDSTLTGNTAAANATANTAFTPDSIAEIDCSGYSKLRVHVLVSSNSLGAIPTAVIDPWFKVSADQFRQDVSQRIRPLLFGSDGYAISQTIEVAGQSAVKLLLSSISGPGAAVTLHYQLES